MKGYALVIGAFALILAALFTVNLSFQRSLQMEMAEQFNKQQLLLARGQASNIEELVNHLRTGVLDTAGLLAVFPVERENQFALLAQTVLRAAGDMKTGLSILDGSGRTVYAQWHIPAERPDPRHFADLKQSPCGSRPVIRQNTQRITITAPVCRSGSFSGAVIAAVDIQDIARHFLGSLKSGLRGYAWMMDHQGNLLFHPSQPDMEGRNIYHADTSCFKCHTSFDVEKKIIEGKADYSGRHIAPTGEDKIIAFSSASVGESRWIVAVSAPYTEVTMPFQTSRHLSLLLIVLVIVIAGASAWVIIVLNRKRLRAEERARDQEKLEQYAEELEQKVEFRTRELSAEKEKLNTIVSTVGSGIVLLGTDGKLQWINQTMKEIAGRDITGVTYGDICTDCIIVGSSAVNEVTTEVLTNLFGRKDKYYQVTTAPVKGENGEICGFIKLVHDITEMRKMEEQMVNSEKLACLERLTSGIAHEIGNPLTSVFSFVELLKDMEKDEFKRESLETIHASMNSIANSLQTLSTFSKVPAPELRPWKIGSILENALSLVQFDKRAQDITIMKDLPLNTPEVITDGNQLSQAIVNIILNAADAMPDGGTLTIQGRVRDSHVEIDFTDTGVGIPREALTKIFDPFFTTKASGTGLGLAVSHDIIQRLGGALTVDSEPGKGSLFRISLPLGGPG